MSSFLARMAQSSGARAAEARSLESETELRRRAMATFAPARVDFSENRFDLIAEVKFRSPSAGSLVDEDRERDVAARARAYAAAGAAVISVLTEPEHFGGSLHDLEQAARAVAIPVMRKDFLVDPYQVWEARACGAAGILLIVRMLDDDRLGAMLAAAAEAGMFVLLEAFDGDDLARIVSGTISGASSEAVWIGVNTRDLATLEVVPERLTRLASRIPSARISVAESGILTAGDAADAASSGYSLALVGTALMRSEDPGNLIAAMLGAGRAVRCESASGLESSDRSPRVRR
jgi:indole-3-glycerol phosphate synthase